MSFISRGSAQVAHTFAEKSIESRYSEYVLKIVLQILDKSLPQNWTHNVAVVVVQHVALVEIL